MIADLDTIRQFYSQLPSRITATRERLGRPLSLAEKILFAHLAQPPNAEPEREQSYAYLHPDRVAMQDATAQMALLQFLHAGRKQTAVPTSVHCDHLIRAHIGAEDDLRDACEENREIYAFLQSVAAKYGIGFWQPGAGIIHQVILENYAFPGGMMIGTDSHTPNAGGMGMLAIGVGGADAVDVMAGMPWELRWPGLIGVRLTGKLHGWTSPKDVILKLLGILSVKGGTGRIVEYFGPGTESISCTGKATITNMGAELGATTSVFPFDQRMAAYLRATDREEVASLAEERRACLTADPEIIADPKRYYDQVIEINLDQLEPHVVGPFTPDLARPLSAFRQEIAEKNYPETLTVGLIGSCTNASYEDLDRAAHVAKNALDQGLQTKSHFFITPGSERVRATIERDGQLDALQAIGGTLLANACGPCIGQWQRTDMKPGIKNAIITSFNRNFARRADGNPDTLAFIGSPEIVTAMALAGQLGFNPETDAIQTDTGEIRLSPPSGEELPPNGFVATHDGYIPPADTPNAVEIAVDPNSKRLQLLTPFAPWDGENLTDLLVLVKAKGKCTTDHISPAGPWLKFRGHLDAISDNMLIGATNAYTGEIGKGTNVLSNETGVPLAKIARDYKKRGAGWIIVGDENYGEGSSREHAAMSPRHLGARAVIARSFARIHETNLKKQGVLPLTFQNPADYDRIQATDRISILGLPKLAPGATLTMVLRHADGTSEQFPVKQSLSELQIEWFKAGSALNQIAAQAAASQ